MFHSCYDSITAWKMSVMFIFHQPKQVKRLQIYTIQCERGRAVQLRLAVCSMVFKLVWSLMLSGCKRGYRLLQPDFGILSLQLSQCPDVAVRINGLYRSQKNHMDHLLPISKGIAHHFAHWGMHLEDFLQWGVLVLPLPFQLQFVVVTLCLL